MTPAGPPCPRDERERWAPVVRAWDRTPARLMGGAASLGVEGVFAAAVSGARRSASAQIGPAAARADFHAADGMVEEPGTLLPGGGDRGPLGYAERVDGVLGTGTEWRCEVRHALGLDVGAWRAVRRALRGLWESVGWPALPLTTEIVLANGTVRCHRALPSGEAVLLWVVRGTVTVEFTDPAETAAPGPGTPPQTGSAGDLLYRPAGLRNAERYGPATLALRLSLPAQYRAALAAVKNQLGDLAAATTDTTGTADTAGTTDTTPGPTAIGELTKALVHGDAVERTLRARWAARRSAAGLEPAPAPAPASGLTAGTPVRLSGEIVHLGDGPGRTLWAVNGHLLPLSGRVPALLHQRLTSASAPVTARELNETLGAPPGSAGVLPLLRALDRLRALTVAPGAADTRTTRLTAAPAREVTPGPPTPNASHGASARLLRPSSRPLCGEALLLTALTASARPPSPGVCDRAVTRDTP
ncbi:hypothetical protein [Streptomyces otsuchiensis]|uniref:hypothetical protein n=1 Tax=Streptomyces otsuchiensis TaxID=2681388 RepID=UPI0010318A82|nr:hypothetical protein [Streptomyces otsuchiensis]